MNNTATIAGRKITRAKVLAAVAECDRLGTQGFLDRYGYRRASRWHLRMHGRSYPSKAIVGVAAGLKAADFFGGVRGAAQALATLGLHLRCSRTGELMSVKLDVLRRACERRGLTVREKDWPSSDVQPTAYFASGSNQPEQIKAMGYCGVDIGVAAPNVSKNAEAELLELAGSDVQVFVDSGAFSEVSFAGGVRRIVKPMTDGDWQRVLGLYDRLAIKLGDQVWIVAPDCVGDQDETLARLRRYAERIRGLHHDGARVMVAMQKGALSQADFAAKVDEVLKFYDWIPAMPCKKAATTPEELAAFVRERGSAQARDRLSFHVHLLGIGVRNPQAKLYLAAFADGGSVSMDSCWIAANAVRSGKPRRLTRAADMAKHVLEHARCATVSSVALSVYCCLAGSGLST